MPKKQIIILIVIVVLILGGIAGWAVFQKSKMISETTLKTTPTPFSEEKREEVLKTLGAPPNEETKDSSGKIKPEEVKKILETLGAPQK